MPNFPVFLVGTQSSIPTSGAFNLANAAGFTINSGDNTEDDGAGGVEAGIAGQTVNLVNPANGGVVASTTTDANGDYSFTGLSAGNYVVDFPNNVNGDTVVIALADGQALTDIAAS